MSRTSPRDVTRVVIGTGAVGLGATPVLGPARRGVVVDGGAPAHPTVGAHARGFLSGDGLVPV